MKKFLIVLVVFGALIGVLMLGASTFERASLGSCPPIDWLHTTEPCTVLTPDDMTNEHLYVIRETDGTIRVIRSPELLPKRFIIAKVGNKKTAVPFAEDKK